MATTEMLDRFSTTDGYDDSSKLAELSAELIEIAGADVHITDGLRAEEQRRDWV